MFNPVLYNNGLTVVDKSDSLITYWGIVEDNGAYCIKKVSGRVRSDLELVLLYNSTKASDSIVLNKNNAITLYSSISTIEDAERIILEVILPSFIKRLSRGVSEKYVRDNLECIKLEVSL